MENQIKDDVQVPIVILSYNRPQYLIQVIESLLSQQKIELAGRRIALFQDGSLQSSSSSALTADDGVRASMELFRQCFPDQPIFSSDINLGVALNYDRAERYVFEELNASAAIFLEDDLVLSDHYLTVLEHMLKAYDGDARVGYVAAYGNHRSDSKVLENVCTMHHNWAFGLFKRHWLAMRPYIKEYLGIVSRSSYRNRDHSEIKRLFNSWGFNAPATSQDAAKTIATCLVRSIKLNTVACFGRYIGERGLHMTPELFEAGGYASVRIEPRPTTEFAPISSKLFHDIRFELLTWGQAENVYSNEHSLTGDSEQSFHRASSEASAGKYDLALKSAVVAIATLLAGSSGAHEIHVAHYTPKDEKGLANQNHIYITIRGTSLHLLFEENIVGPGFANYFRAFDLISNLVGLAIKTVAGGATVVDLGDGSDVGSYRRVAFSSGLPDTSLIIDPDFWHTSGYQAFQSILEKSWIPWRQRSNKVMWRGASTGRRLKEPSLINGAIVDWTWLQRLHLCDLIVKMRYPTRVDVGIDQLVHIPEEQIRAQAAERFLRNRVSDLDRIFYRYTFAIDGNGGADSGLMRAMLSGCCVLLVSSQRESSTWLHTRLAPWETHIPVRADLADLEERLSWAFGNPTACEAIARRALSVASSFRFHTQLQASSAVFASALQSY